MSILTERPAFTESILKQLHQQLSEQLEVLDFNKMQGASHFVQLQAQVCEQLGTAALLSWLKAQRHQKEGYPQAFWQQRESEFAWASFGSVRQFNSLHSAQAFVQGHALTLMGGLPFEGACRFFLPRLVITKNQHIITACITLETDKFEQERASCRQLLAHFCHIESLGELPGKEITRERAYDFPLWQQHIEQAIAQIQQGTFHKVVLANATKLHFREAVCAYRLLAQSEQQNQGCYHFLWAENASDLFIGSSPEKLYARQAKNLSTEALAGTAAISPDPNETEQNRIWLLSDEKNRQENQLVVDDIRQQLAGISYQFEVEDFSIKQLKNVQHLRRNIQVGLRSNVYDADCLTRIHPTAAIAGLPREEAKQFIHSHEPFSRGWYAGAFGLLSTTSAEFCVTIRSALVEERCLTVYAGAGIVAGSTPENEWHEIERKSDALIHLLHQEESKKEGNA